MSSAAFMSPPVVAKLLGVDPEKVRDWIKRGELRGYDIADRPGGQPRWRIRESDLEAFLAARQAIPPAPVARRRKPKVDKNFIRYSESM